MKPSALKRFARVLPAALVALSVVGIIGPTPSAQAATVPAQVAAGDSHTCAVRPNQTVACWGRNENGQLGNRSLVDSTVPVTVTGISTAKVSAPELSSRCLGSSPELSRRWSPELSRSLGVLGGGGLGVRVVGSLTY
jgi:Regulator of chromosome condensation (RCC1) repeat